MSQHKIRILQPFNIELCSQWHNSARETKAPGRSPSWVSAHLTCRNFIAL